MRAKPSLDPSTDIDSVNSVFAYEENVDNKCATDDIS